MTTETKLDPEILANESISRVLKENASLQRTLKDLGSAVDAHSIVAITDRRGIILEANSKFVELSKFTREELIGAPQNIVNSGHHPREFWKEMWATIGRGEVWQRELCNRAKDGSEYWVATTIVPMLDERGRPERYIALRTDTTKLHAASRRMRELAYRDPLTGLLNRTAMLERLNECTADRSNGYRAFVTVALEDLGVLNDAFGYPEGDRLLLHTAERLIGMQPRPAEVARIDNSVFALIFDELGKDRFEAEGQAMILAEQVVFEVGTTIRLDLGFSLEPAVRVGFALCGGGGSRSGEEVYQQAEIARRRVSMSRGTHQPSKFEPEMVEEIRERTKMLLELRHAVAHDELRLFIQPIVDIAGTVEGYEALVRWQHPERGLVPPGDFIPLAEQSGLIVDLGTWVLDEACRILGEWARSAPQQHLTLSVNVSERQLNPRNFPDSVRAALARHGAPASRLKVEVTESLMHDDIERSIQVLDELRETGVQVALDDFGTGHSSLSYLVRLPVDQLKIDRSFVLPITEDSNGAAIVQAIVELAHVMQLKVVVEGVETREQFLLLRELGVDSFQGYLFGRPAPLGCDS
ncbi:putative bifunctional diguanylate cyclase/phosphodiesterase [Leucobacter sp. W1153]|uniref:putative bifunctional diguanylate cyclase/phosphodiesterase n=1 Tax=Leucobacter sp. W1153 TaxID=3439064 RepID=UPI003F2D7D85